MSTTVPYWSNMQTLIVSLRCDASDMEPLISKRRPLASGVIAAFQDGSPTP